MDILPWIYYHGYITMDILPFIMDYGYIAHNTPVLKSQVQNVFFFYVGFCRVQGTEIRNMGFSSWGDEAAKSNLQMIQMFTNHQELASCIFMIIQYIINYINDNVRIIDISYRVYYINHDIIDIYIYIYIIEGSLEVKLPTIWTVEKQRWEESEEKRSEERRCRCAKR